MFRKRDTGLSSEIQHGPGCVVAAQNPTGQIGRTHGVDTRQDRIVQLENLLIPDIIA